MADVRRPGPTDPDYQPESELDALYRERLELALSRDEAERQRTILIEALEGIRERSRFRSCGCGRDTFKEAADALVAVGMADEKPSVQSGGGE